MAANIAIQRPPWEAQQFMREEISTVISNRSAAYLESGDYIGALIDADTVISLRRNWSKGHFRKAKALLCLGRLDEAKDAVRLGLSFEPLNTVSWSACACSSRLTRYSGIGWFLGGYRASSRDSEVETGSKREYTSITYYSCVIQYISRLVMYHVIYRRHTAYISEERPLAHTDHFFTVSLLLKPRYLRVDLYISRQSHCCALSTNAGSRRARWCFL